MSIQTDQFRSRARIAIEDIQLQNALEGATGRFRSARTAALQALPGADRMRDRLKAIRHATLARLGEHLEVFERNAISAGAQVHWARNAGEASQIVTGLARDRDVRMAAKSKSMATEEIHLNQELQAAGIAPVETDLGEWIVQLAGEPPSHIIAPAIHQTRQQVAALFQKETGRAEIRSEVPDLIAVARQTLRARFLEAGMGISGANIAVAETGSIVLVTNEGNGRMVTSLPKVHVAVVGIEKLAPTWEDAAVWLSLLARSATGQPLSIYTSIITGPARPGDLDGPEEVHIVLLDNNRSRYVGTEFEEVLQCIRCGACLNVCPVYREAGGHAYGSPYSGPIGAVVSPLLFGQEQFSALPHASTLCGACLEVCPVRIDLPRMLVELRAQQVGSQQTATLEAWAERGAANLLAGPARWTAATRIGRLLQRPLVHRGAVRLPARLDPTGGRGLPALAERPFRELWDEIE